MDNSTERELLLRLHDKIDNVQVDIKTIEITQAKHEENLLQHMKRSDAVEARQDLIEDEVKPILQGLGFLKVFAKIGTIVSSWLYVIARFWH